MHPSKNLWDYLSFPDRTERDQMEGAQVIHELRVEPSELGCPDGWNQLRLLEPKLHELLRHYNNIVVEVSVSYVLPIHFINKGVFDSPYCPKDAADDQTEGFACRFWFGYFTDSLFVQLQAIWDILMNILNHHYGYAYVNDQRMAGKLLKRLKQEHPTVHAFIDRVWKSPIHQTVHQYRVNLAHSTSSINATDTVTFDNNGVKVTGQGRYEKPSDMVDSMDRYITFAARSVHGLLTEVRKEAE